MVSILKKYNLLFDTRQKKRLCILFFMMLIGAFLEVLGVSLMLPLVTAIMNPNITETNVLIAQICMMCRIDTHEGFIVFCIALLIAVFIFKDLFLMLQYYVQARFVANNRFAMQRRMLHAFLLRPYEYYLNAQSGEILQMISGDIGQTFALLTTMLSFATESIVAVALIAAVFVIEPIMTTGVALSMGVIMLVITKAVKPILSREGQSFRHNNAVANKWLLQAITGIKEIKVAHKEMFFEDSYHESGTRVIRAEKINTVLSNTPRLLIEMCCVCSVLAVIAMMILRGYSVDSLLPALGTFAMAAVKLMPSANRIVGAFNSIAFQEPALNKALENLKILTDSVGEDCGRVATQGDINLMVQDAIVMKGISYSYPNSERRVLHQADMIIPVGKSVGIVGTSGAGKTTAVDILLGLLIPQEGQVLADGMNVMEHYPQWLAKLSYIPQSIFMLDDTIRANVAFGLNADELDDEQVWYALEEAQLAEFVRGLPDGLDTTIGERGVRLSGGQRQRIGIARALYTNPELLIFDEATSALDNETEAAIMESINSLHGKKTMIIIAHRLQTIAGCDMVYRVGEGKIQRER